MNADITDSLKLFLDSDPIIEILVIVLNFCSLIVHRHGYRQSAFVGTLPVP